MVTKKTLANPGVLHRLFFIFSNLQSVYVLNSHLSFSIFVIMCTLNELCVNNRYSIITSAQNPLHLGFVFGIISVRRK